MGIRHFQVQAQMTARAAAFHGLLLPSLALCCLPLLARDARAQAAQGALPDVTIEAKEKKIIDRNKPAFEMSLKENSPLKPFLKVGKDVRYRLPDEIVRSMRYTTGLSTSPYALAPSTHWIFWAWKNEPARTFHPLRDLAQAYGGKNPPRETGSRGAKPSWEFDVVDSAGSVFRKYSGEGLPPEEIAFDGRSSEGKWIDVGQSYSGVVNYWDSAGRPHTAAGSPFAVAGMGLKDSSGFILKLALRPMFDRGNQASPKLSKFGRGLLREAAGIIQRFYPGYNFEVGAYSLDSDPRTVGDFSRLCAKALASRLLVPSEKVLARSFPGTPDLKERIEILVLNR